MRVSELVSQFRREFADLEEAPLIQDEDIVRYIDDAQKLFCRLTYGIEATRGRGVTLREDNPWYPIDPDILHIRRATLERRDLALVSADRAKQYGVELSGMMTGFPQALVQGLEKNYVFIFPTPTVAVDAKRVHFSVFRLPQTIESANDDLEIDEQHHLHLLHWVKAKAYDNHDADAFDKRKSNEYRRAFEDYCKQSKMEQSRATHEAGCVAYGGL